MPVEFFYLPGAIASDPRPPSRVVWLALFAAFIVAGIVLTLTLWPKANSTRTWTFWAWMLAVPVLLYGIALACRLHLLYEMPALQAQAFNDERKKAIDHNIEFAQRPLALLGSAYLTAMGTRDVATRVACGEQVLAAQPTSTSAEVKRHTMLARSPSDSLEDALKHMFDLMLTALVPSLRYVAAEEKIAVWLFPADQATAEHAEAAWAQASNRLAHRFSRASQAYASKSLMTLDRWLDSSPHRTTVHYALLLAVERHDRVADASGEAVVALLLSDVLPNKNLPSDNTTVLVHRPVVNPACPEWTPLATAIQWGGRTPEHISTIWRSGLAARSFDQIVDEYAHLQSGSPPTLPVAPLPAVADVDAAIGDTGVAAPWLGLALAAEHATRTGMPQLVASAAGEHPCFMVVQMPPHLNVAA
jgi:hypothetical protein